MQILDAPQNQVDHIPFASFGKRFAASIIDGFLIGLITSFSDKLELSVSSGAILYLVLTAVQHLYQPIMEGSSGATLGKKWMGLVVVNEQLEKISWVQAILRNSFYLFTGLASLLLEVYKYFNPNLTMFTPQGDLGLSYVDSALLVIIVGLFLLDVAIYLANNNRRALHDIIAGTYVVDAGRANIY